MINEKVYFPNCHFQQTLQNQVEQNQNNEEICSIEQEEKFEQNQRKTKRVPFGTSHYQATWILSDDDHQQDQHSNREENVRTN